MACDGTNVAMICDRDRSQLSRVSRLAPEAAAVERIEDVLENPVVDAVAIATPVHTHVAIASAAINAGKHVLVEKPLASSVEDAEKLVTLARQRGLILMVDHTFIYSPAVRKIKELVTNGALGQIYYIDSVRINLGLFQSDINVLWDLAPHDLSIVDHLLGRLPRSLSAAGASHTGGKLEDIAYLNLDFGDSLLASFHVNWLSPVKIRHIIVGGSERSIVYNDLDPMEPVKIYERGIDLSGNGDARRGLLVSYRTGDTHAPHLPREEALQNMVRHFAECIRERTRPITDGEAGLRIVHILEAAQRSIKAQGGRITL
jgi:predicted dehydrogenase